MQTLQKLCARAAAVSSVVAMGDRCHSVKATRRAAGDKGGGIDMTTDA